MPLLLSIVWMCGDGKRGFVRCFYVSGGEEERCDYDFAIDVIL